MGGYEGVCVEWVGMRECAEWMWGSVCKVGGCEGESV